MKTIIFSKDADLDLESDVLLLPEEVEVADKQIIVYNDASSDNSLNILENYKNNYPNLFFIYNNTQNIGPTKNIEKAIKACSGDIIILADQDDYWQNNKVNKMVKFFDQNPKINGIFTNGFIMNSLEKIDKKYLI